MYAAKPYIDTYFVTLKHFIVGIVNCDKGPNWSVLMGLRSKGGLIGGLARMVGSYHLFVGN